MTGDEDTRWFRADVRGLRPGHFATTSSSYVHVTSNFDVARAFAVERGNCAVYEVELGGYIDVDLDYPPQSGAGCKKCDWATIIRVVEEEVDWLLEDAWKFMSRYHLWGTSHPCTTTTGTPPHRQKCAQSAAALTSFASLAGTRCRKSSGN